MTISNVGSSSLLQQLLQARSTASVSAIDDPASIGAFDQTGQDASAGGKNDLSPPMRGWSSSGQGFSADTLASLLSTQQTRSADRAAAMFAEADADGDGAVTADELSTALAARAPKDTASGATDATDIAAKMLAKGDSNGDGALSLDEFQAMKPHHGHHGAHGPPPSGEAGGAQASTDAADLNGDGVVSADELAQTLTSAVGKLGPDVSSDASSLMQKLLGQLAGNLAGSSTSASVDLAA